MRITILTYGSRGDVQPCLALALALALQQAGDTPLLVLPASLRFLADEGESIHTLKGYDILRPPCGTG